MLKLCSENASFHPILGQNWILKKFLVNLVAFNGIFSVTV